MIALNTIYNEDCLTGMQRIDDGSVDVILTDPPYGITQNSWDVVVPFERLWAEYNRIIKPNGAILIFCAEPFASYLRISNIKSYKYDWIWNKSICTGFLNAKKQPLRCHEIICVFYKKQPVYNPQFKIKKHKRDFTKTTICPDSSNYGKQRNYVSTINEDSPAYPVSILEIRGVVNNSHEKVNHPTQKPISVSEYMINTYTNPGDLVLDPFSGSASTAIAAYNTGRSFIGFEIDKEFYDASIERLNKVLETPKQRDLFGT
jgi:site-specific DNA-methyltransferase (adenine-specific)